MRDKVTVSEQIIGTVGVYVYGCLDEICHESYEALKEIGKEHLFDDIHGTVQEELDKALDNIHIDLKYFFKDHGID